MHCRCPWAPETDGVSNQYKQKKLHLVAAEWSKNMNWSGLSKRFAALALSSMIVASSTTSVLALQLPPDDDEDEDEIEYSRSEALEAAIEAQQNGTYGIHDDEDDQDDSEEEYIETVWRPTSGTLQIAGSTANSSANSITISGNNAGSVSISSGNSIRVASTSSAGSISVGASSTSSATSSMAATIRNAQASNNNTDIKGWLKVSGTNINYGVIKTPANQDVNYYESKGYNKQYSKNGVLWTNNTVNFGTSSTLSKNTCIFGHNWTNSWKYAYANRAKDVMFAQLAAFKNLSFAKQNQKITFSTEKEDMTFQIFAVFICNADKYNYVTANPTTTAFSKMISEARSLSFFDYDTSVSTSDKIISLSTCIDAYYKNGVRQTNQRLVVMGKLVKGDAANSNVTVTTNTDAKKPTF